MEHEQFDLLKPIPYIADLTQKGVMTIGWNISMVPPTNYTTIPDTQVAVRSWNDVLEE